MKHSPPEAVLTVARVWSGAFVLQLQAKVFRAVARRTDKREFVFNGTIDVASIKI